MKKNLPATKKQTTKKMKIIGQKEFIDSETGEIEKMQLISFEDRDFNFDKIWIIHILEALDKIGNQKIKVLNTLLKLKNNENMIIATQRKLAKESGVGLNTVSETLQALIETNFIKMLQSGVYQINPDILFKGKNNKRLNILFQYNNIENDNECKTKRITKKEEKIDDNPETYLIEE